jgi:hypothetical protein
MANSSLSATSGSEAGGFQLSEERRKGSGRVSCYDPVLILGRVPMSRPRGVGGPAGIPRPLPTTTLYTASIDKVGLVLQPVLIGLGAPFPVAAACALLMAPSPE